jgi:NAD(P) transhydrogenase subunit alpha
MTFLCAATQSAPQSDGGDFLILGLWVLLLAIFLGFELITKVPPTLHTPLMSGANAISGITLVGALYCAGSGYPVLGKLLGILAIAMATINVVGGFLVTDRMLRMFGSKKKDAKQG